MPFLVSTNTPGTGMDAPTWRGAYDRFLILPQGRLNIVEFDFYRRVAQQGIPERSVWQFSWQGRPRFDPIWDMVLEGSTGFSGTLARQVTLSKTTADQLQTLDLLDALETAADEQSVVLNVHGVFVADGLSRTVTMQFIAGRYVHSHQESEFATRDDLIQMAMDGEFIGTFTAHHGENADAMDNPQPALWTRGPIQSQRGHQQFPILHPGNTEMAISGRHIVAGARAIVDGRVVPASVLVAGNDNLDIRLETLPEPGLHLLQVQNPGGRFSNDFLFNVTASKAEATALVEQRRQQDRDIRDAIAAAIADNDAGTLQTLLNRPQQSGRINERRPASGSTPLSTAALHGKSDLVRLLLRRGAAVEGTNRDGNTALHVAAFLCRKEIVEILLEKNADVDQKNQRGQTPLDVVSAGWNDDLANVYRSIATLANIEIDLESMKSDRSEMKRLLSSPTD
ncbi:MAG: ankyrin repeat domain-containing protein [Planctomycetota bacterium]